MVYTKEAFQEIYARYKESRLTIAAFCSNEGISRTKFYYWLRNMRSETQEQRDFLPINIRKGSNGLSIQEKKSAPRLQMDNKEDRQYEICYPNGVTVKFCGPMTLEEYRTLIFLT